MFLGQGANTPPALLPDGGVPPYPAYGLDTFVHYPRLFL